MTSLVSALTARFWCCSPEDSAFFLGVCLQLGPLASFQSLLSVYGSEMMMFNDMIVAVEDLRNVEFTLILVDHQEQQSKSPRGGPGQSGTTTKRPTDGVLEYHSFPVPRVTGSRSGLKVMVPVPDHVYTLLPPEQVWSITQQQAILFNFYCGPAAVNKCPPAP